MRSWILASILFLGMLGILACSTVMRRGDTVSYVDPGPHFDHAGHLARGVDCADCHGGEKEGWRSMPSLSACTECHEDIDGEAPPQKRAAAFFDSDGNNGVWTKSTPLDAEIVFDHAHHVLASGGPKSCSVCHAEVIASKGVATSTYLTMDECIACHEQAAPSKNDCEDCHREIRKDRAPKSHGPGWKRAHGRMASMGDLDPLPDDCALCHKRSDCDTCHRAEMPSDHTNLFRLSGHGIAAAIDRDRCQVCHTTDSCYLCHQQMKPRNHRGTWGSPFDRHCYSCHLPLDNSDDQGCGVCHKSAPGHAQAPMRPANAPHMTMDSNQCRACHTPPPHPDNGQSCLLCHK